MANKYYALAKTSWVANMQTALIDKYGAGVTIHYTDADNIIFTPPNTICDKVIKMTNSTYTATNTIIDRFYIYYGDSWTSGTTIINPVQFCGNAKTGFSLGTHLFSIADLILGDAFIYLSLDQDVYNSSCLIGKLSNGKYICAGWTTTTADTTSNANIHGYYTDGTSGGEIEVITLHSTFRDAGKFVVMPLIFKVAEQVLLNGDGSYAYIPGVYNCAYSVHAVGSSFYVGQTGWYHYSLSSQFYTSIFFELSGVLV